MTHTLPLHHHLHSRYSIQRIIGQGGFGITYEAHDQLLDIKVCIKELFIAGNSTRGANQTVVSQNTTAFSFGDFVTRFMDEARQLAKFRHPNIVKVIDVFQENKTAYMVMEFVEGVTLKEIISKTGASDFTAASKIIWQLLDAVEEVHAKGMLHRDIKPDNILITAKNEVVLIDFGSARAFAEGKTTTQTAILTPGYAPPEQYSDRAQRGPFTDIYALGATMYFILTGQKPLPITDRVTTQMPAPHELNPNISSQISSIIMLTMQLKAEDRFQSIQDFRAALKQLQEPKAKEVPENKPVIKPNTPIKESTKEQPVLEKKQPIKKHSPVQKKTGMGILRILAIFAIIIGGGFLILKIFGNAPSSKNNGQALKITATSSPHYPPASASFTYGPENAIDGNLNTFWGADEKSYKKWLKLSFDRSVELVGIRIHIGSHYPSFNYKGRTIDLFSANAALTSAKIEFSDGTFNTVNFDDVDEIQTIHFDKPVNTKSLTIVPLDYRKGEEWAHDISISEISPILKN